MTSQTNTANSYIPTQYVADYQNGWSRETYNAAHLKAIDLDRLAHKPLSSDQGPVADQYAIRRKAKAESDAIMQELQNARAKPRAVHQSGSNIIPVFIRTKRLMVLDMAGRQYDPDTVEKSLRKARRAKKDGVMFLNYYDWGGAPGTLSRPQTTVAMFDPKNIRSIFAHFDSTEGADLNEDARNAGEAASFINETAFVVDDFITRLAAAQQIARTTP